MNIREPIYTALFNLVLNHPEVKGQFVTTGRFLIPVTDIDPERMPALFLLQHGENWVRKGRGIPAIRTLHCSFVMYAWTPEHAYTYPATLINTMMDVLDDAIEMNGTPGNVQTLGGLVNHVYIEGQVQVIEGQLGAGQQASVLVAPITMLLP